MKITDPEVIKSGERELIDTITGDIDWDAIETIFRERHQLAIQDDVEYRQGDIVVYENQIAYKLDFDVKVTLSVLFDREGKHIALTTSGDLRRIPDNDEDAHDSGEDLKKDDGTIDDTANSEPDVTEGSISENEDGSETLTPADDMVNETADAPEDSSVEDENENVSVGNGHDLPEEDEIPFPIGFDPELEDIEAVDTADIPPVDIEETDIDVPLPEPDDLSALLDHEPSENDDIEGEVVMDDAKTPAENEGLEIQDPPPPEPDDLEKLLDAADALDDPSDVLPDTLPVDEELDEVDDLDDVLDETDFDDSGVDTIDLDDVMNIESEDEQNEADVSDPEPDDLSSLLDDTTGNDEADILENPPNEEPDTVADVGDLSEELDELIDITDIDPVEASDDSGDSDTEIVSENGDDAMTDDDDFADIFDLDDAEVTENEAVLSEDDDEILGLDTETEDLAPDVETLGEPELDPLDPPDDLEGLLDASEDDVLTEMSDTSETEESDDFNDILELEADDEADDTPLDILEPEALEDTDEFSELIELDETTEENVSGTKKDRGGKRSGGSAGRMTELADMIHEINEE